MGGCVCSKPVEVTDEITLKYNLLGDEINEVNEVKFNDIRKV